MCICWLRCQTLTQSDGTDMRFMFLGDFTARICLIDPFYGLEILEFPLSHHEQSFEKLMRNVAMEALHVGCYVQC